MRFVFYLLIFSLPLNAQNHWPDVEISYIFDQIRDGNLEAAQATIRSKGVTDHDFGLDLLHQGRGLQAVEWFEHLDGDIYTVGLAWSYRALGDALSAVSYAEAGLNSRDQLVRARANYILALLANDGHQPSLALQYVQESHALFTSLRRVGGMSLCSIIIEQLTVHSKAGPVGSTGYPPRDDTDS